MVGADVVDELAAAAVEGAGVLLVVCSGVVLEVVGAAVEGEGVVLEEETGAVLELVPQSSKQVAGDTHFVPSQTEFGIPRSSSQTCVLPRGAPVQIATGPGR